MLNDNEKTPWSRINAHKSFKDNPVSFDRVKLYRTIHDPVVHYVLGRPGAEPNLLSFINSVFEDKGEPPVRQLSILNPFDAKTYLNDKQTIVDILAEDENHRKFNIEFQVWNHKFFIERCLYYWA